MSSRKNWDSCAADAHPGWEETRQAWLGYFTGLDERLLDCLKELRKRYKALRAEQHQSLRDGLGLQSGILLKGETAHRLF